MNPAAEGANIREHDLLGRTQAPIARVDHGNDGHRQLSLFF